MIHIAGVESSSTLPDVWLIHHSANSRNVNGVLECLMFHTRFNAHFLLSIKSQEQWSRPHEYSRLRQHFPAGAWIQWSTVINTRKKQTDTMKQRPESHMYSTCMYFIICFNITVSPARIQKRHIAPNLTHKRSRRAHIHTTCEKKHAPGSPNRLPHFHLQQYFFATCHTRHSSLAACFACFVYAHWTSV